MLDGVVRGRLPSSEAGVELATLDWGGDGELVVIHHANGFCGAAYALIAVELRDRYRVVSIDARGHGDSTTIDAVQNPAAYNWNTMAADYAAAHAHLVETLGVDRIRLAIGHSFGGVLALAASVQNPGLIEEALLLDPVVLPPISERGDWTARGKELSTMTRRRRAVYATREDAYAHCVGRDLFKAFRPEALALYVAEGMTRGPSGEIRLKCDPEVEAAVFENDRTMDIFDVAAEIETRTHFIHAAQGRFPQEVYDRLATRMPNAQVESCEADHLFAFENPEIVVERVHD